jgi:hypothetical protein
MSRWWRLSSRFSDCGMILATSAGGHQLTSFLPQWHGQLLWQGGGDRDHRGPGRSTWLSRRSRVKRTSSASACCPCPFRMMEVLGQVYFSYMWDFFLSFSLLDFFFCTKPFFSQEGTCACTSSNHPVQSIYVLKILAETKYMSEKDRLRFKCNKFSLNLSQTNPSDF